MTIKGQQIGKDQKANNTGDALFLKLFGGEVLTSFERQAKTLSKAMSDARYGRDAAYRREVELKVMHAQL